MDRKKVQLALVLAVLFGAYLTVVFLLKQNGYGKQFWVSFGFVVFAFLVLAIGLFFVSSKSKSGQVVGLPVDSLVWFYFAAEILLGTIFMFFDGHGWAFIAYFLPQFVLVVLFLLVFIPAIMSPSNYKDEPKKDKE